MVDDPNNTLVMTIAYIIVESFFHSAFLRCFVHFDGNFNFIELIVVTRKNKKKKNLLSSACLDDHRIAATDDAVWRVATAIESEC